MKANEQRELTYLRAVKRVKEIKGFYTHLMVYVVINIMVSAINMFLNHQISDSASFFKALGHFSTYMTWVLWGIGLLIHGLNVFWLKASYFKKWEDRKLQEFMNEDLEDSTQQYE